MNYLNEMSNFIFLLLNKVYVENKEKSLYTSIHPKVTELCPKIIFFNYFNTFFIVFKKKHKIIYVTTINIG